MIKVQVNWNRDSVNVLLTKAKILSLFVSSAKNHNKFDYMLWRLIFSFHFNCLHTEHVKENSATQCWTFANRSFLIALKTVDALTGVHSYIFFKRLCIEALDNLDRKFATNIMTICKDIAATIPCDILVDETLCSPKQVLRNQFKNIVRNEMLLSCTAGFEHSVHVRRTKWTQVCCAYRLKSWL